MAAHGRQRQAKQTQDPQPQTTAGQAEAGDATSLRRSRSLLRRLARVGGFTAAGLVGLAVLALGLTATLEALDRARVVPPGALVELADGRSLHLHVHPGPEHDTDASGARPTVVLEAGAGGSAAVFSRLHAVLAEHTTVVAYDRAGSGFSDPRDGPAAAASVVADLHEGLDAAGVGGPFVLVGHSLGAAYARTFTATHPDEVAGLVLLDPVHEEQLVRLPPEERAAFAEAQEQLEVAPALARLGVFRLADPQADVVDALPADAGEQHRARSVTAAGMRAYAEEIGALPDLLEEVGDHAGTPAFGAVPARVVSAGQPGAGESPQGREVMDALHLELAARSPKATHVTIEGADHLGLVVAAEHTDTVAEIVIDLLDEVAVSAANGREP